MKLASSLPFLSFEIELSSIQGFVDEFIDAEICHGSGRIS